MVEAASLAEARRLLTRLEGLPLVCEHRDFSPWNLFVHAGDRLAVFDWESSEPEGLPLLDLIYFLTYMASALRGEDPADVIRAWHAAHDRKVSRGRSITNAWSDMSAASVWTPGGPRALPPHLDDPLAVGVSPDGGRCRWTAIAGSVAAKSLPAALAGGAGPAAQELGRRLLRGRSRHCLGLRRSAPGRETPGSRRTRSTGQSWSSSLSSELFTSRAASSAVATMTIA